MENINLPPFYVGQEVVAVKDHRQGAFKKEFTSKVTSISRCVCGCWNITVGISSTLPFGHCVDCSHMYRTTDEWKFKATYFAPITSTFQAITFEKVIQQELTSVN